MRPVQHILSQFRTNDRSWVKALIVGIVFPALALCVKLLVSPWMSTERAPFLLFFGAVVGAAWTAGLWAGLLATVVSATLADLVFFPPFGTLAVHGTSDAFNIIAFVLEATLISFLATFRDRVRKVAEEANKRDQSLTSQLRSEQQISAAATHELESSRERLSLLAATTADGIWDYDYDADRIWWSDRTYRLLGYGPGEFEVTLERVDLMVHEEDRRSRQEAIAAFLAGETEYYSCEFRLRHKDGTYRWFLSRGSALRNETGRGIRMIGTLADVTERHLAEITSRRLAAIVTSSDDGIIGKDLNGIITSWNTGAERIFAYTADEMIGTPIMRLIPPDRHEEEAEIISRIRRGERFDHFETIRLAKDGRRLNVSITVSPIKDSTGQVVGASKVLRDVTERKRAEEALEKAREMAEAANRDRLQLLDSEREARSQAERANRIKDEFLATLSHELRTPLNAILGWANILRLGRAQGEELNQGLDIIERNARLQGQLIEDLLDMSRIISGKVRLDVQRVDLSAVLKESIETLRATAEAKGVRLQAVVDPFVGPITGDPNRLRQVFWNLLSNAIKFTPQDGEVQVLLERVNSQAEVSFIDTGEGIAAEFLPYVFDRFHQADASTTRRHGGLGLGLAIVKQLVELHGGSVQVKSGGIGQGATFAVRLPLIALYSELNEERRHPWAALRENQNLAEVSLTNVHVLVVDDEADGRELVKRQLEMAGATVSTAGSVSEAMERIVAGRPNVLVCDIGMRGEDGYSLIRRLRVLEKSQESALPAVALTAYARSEDRTKAIRSGFQNHLTKPVEPSELLAVVSSLVGRKVTNPPVAG